MIVSAMNTKELIKEILNDLIIVERKADYLCQDFRREVIKSKCKYFQRTFDYRSKQKNNWIISIVYKNKLSGFSTAVHYLDEHGFNGIIINSAMESPGHFTHHFLQRFNERFFHQENISKLELFKRFIERNTLEVGHASDRNTLLSRFNDGVGLGYEEYIDDLDMRVRHFKTFISNDMIKSGQQDEFRLIGEEYDEYIKKMFRNYFGNAA